MAKGSKGGEQMNMNDLARRSLPKVSQVFRHAIAHGLVTVTRRLTLTPATSSRSAPSTKRHPATLNECELAELSRAINACDGAIITRHIVPWVYCNDSRTLSTKGKRSPRLAENTLPSHGNSTFNTCLYKNRIADCAWFCVLAETMRSVAR
jgi:hypothetical protein